MIKKIIFFALAILPLLSKAQVTINAQLPPAGFVQKDQLWNLIVINNKEDILDVTIKLNLQDAATGQVVLSANSGNLLIGKGVKVITAKDVQPVLYNYNVADLSRNYLPMGAYVACYQVVATGQKQEPLSEECIHINIDPLSPPLLNTPTDKSEVPTPYPQFTWMPPTPFDMFSNLSYDLLVTEVLPSQTPVEAIEYNTPIYTRSNISQPSESYASSFTKLDTGKVYAWQVVARNGVNYAAKTEVWTFTLKKEDKLEKIIQGTPYIRTKADNYETGIAPNGILKIAYFNRNIDSVVNIKIIDLSDNRNDKAPEFSLPIISGENLLQFDLKKVMHPAENKAYRAELVNSKGEKWAVLFKVAFFKH